MLALLAKNSIADPDLWGYLSFGHLFWQGHKFPYQDVFSYVPTLNPWVPRATRNGLWDAGRTISALGRAFFQE